MNLAQAVQNAMPQDNAVRVGVIVGVDSGVATVSVDGVEREIPRLDSYTPFADEVVLLLRNGGDWIILGAIVGV